MIAEARRTATALKSTGRILFGSDWFDGLRAVLEAPEDALQRWLDGRAPIPGAVWGELERCMATVENMRGAQQRLRASQRRSTAGTPGHPPPAWLRPESRGSDEA